MIFFDLDDTLLDHMAAERYSSRQFLLAHRELFQEDADAFHARWHEITERHIDRVFAGELSMQESRRARLHELFGSQGLSITDEEADEKFATHLLHYQDGWQLHSDAMPCLQTLSQTYKLGVITNGESDQQVAKLQRTSMEHFFDIVVISGEFGTAKPAKDIFLHACHQAERPATQCIYIGDKLHTDALAAQAAGMQGVWLDRNDKHKGNEPLPVIHSLTEFPTLIPTLL